MTDIHSRIKDLREKRGISLEALAELVDVSWQAVQQWEKPEGTAPKRTRLEKVAEVLGTTSTYLLTGMKTELRTYPTGSNVVAMEKTGSAYTHPDKTIAEIISILEATDERGRIMALGATRAALLNYKPAKANPAN